MVNAHLIAPLSRFYYLSATMPLPFLSRILRGVIVSDNSLHKIFPPQHNNTTQHNTMNNTLHTPSPWYIAHHSDINGDQSIDIRHCCDIPPSTPQIHQIARLPENALANACLISAAPDLLSALQAFVDSVEEIIGLSDFGNPSESDFPLNQAREAIRKAKGEA
jgi:hypothetical protein